jgi:ABC-type multidrug transport system fused ATPase/permease subunit
MNVQTDTGIRHDASRIVGPMLKDFSAFAARKGVFALFCVLAGSVLEGAGISLLVPILGLIMGGSSSPRWLQHFAYILFSQFGAQTAFARLLLLLGAFGLLMILRAVVISARDIAIAQLQLGFVEAQRTRIIRRLAEANWSYVSRLRHVRITHVMSGDIQRLSIGISFLLSGGVAVVLLLVQCILALFLAPVAAIGVIILLTAGAFTLRPLLARARSIGGHIAESNLALLNNTTQFLGGLKLAVSQNLEAGFVDETTRLLRTLTERQLAYTRQYVYSRAAVAALSALAGAVLILMGFAWLHVASAILIILLLIVTRMMAPISQIQQGVQQFGQTLSVYEMLKSLDGELTAHASRPLLPGPVIRGEIVFDHVSFLHGVGQGELSRDGAGGVRDFNLTIRPGEFLAVTGRSGAGKTTFADLLVGLYPPHRGRIKIDGHVLEGDLLSGWRRALSYVSQDPFLFHDTLRRNFRWACAQASEAEMWNALSIAGADTLVRRMEQGLDSIVGERGALISGGERQRLALAAALLRSPALLVLDEATGAIDSGGEREILSRLAALPMTIVLIAHRTENLGICDRILELDTGGLPERGIHPELTPAWRRS